MSAEDLAQPVGAWQWDGTRDRGRAIANATGRCLHVLHEYGDREKKPLYLQLPFGSGPRDLVGPGEWVVRTANGRLHVVDADLFDAIRAARIEQPTEIEGTPV